MLQDLPDAPERRDQSTVLPEVSDPIPSEEIMTSIPSSAGESGPEDASESETEWVVAMHEAKVQEFDSIVASIPGVHSEMNGVVSELQRLRNLF